MEPRGRHHGHRTLRQAAGRVAEEHLLEPRPENCRQIKLQKPILTNEELEKLRHLNRLYFRTATLPILFDPAQDGAGLERALEKLY